VGDAEIAAVALVDEGATTLGSPPDDELRLILDHALVEVEVGEGLATGHKEHSPMRF